MKNLWIRGSLPVTLCLCAQLLAIPSTTMGQPFTTVINVPPEADPGSIGSDTQLNLSDGGIIDFSFDAGNQFVPSTNLEVNISGGEVKQYFDAFSGSLINITGGRVANNFDALPGSIVNISGGAIGDIFRVGTSGPFIGPNAIVNISGGNVGSSDYPLVFTGISALNGGTINMSGGTVSNIALNSGSKTTLSGGNLGQLSVSGLGSSNATLLGGEFELNGAPIHGLNSPGDSVTLVSADFAGSLLTSTLSDGAVFIRPLISLDYDLTLTLTKSALPTKASVINVPTDPVPLGLRAGQTLNLSAGGNLTDYFTAIRSELNVSGGSVGNWLQLLETTANITDGSLGDNTTALSGSIVNISGGAAGINFKAESNSTVNISGGEVGKSTQANAGSFLNISGGSVASGFNANTGSTVNISGGTVGSNFDALAGSDVHLTGGELKLDGVAVPNLGSIGDSVSLSLPTGSILTGILSDGSTFIFSPLAGDSFEDDTVTFTTTPTPAVPSVINAPTDPIPLGLRAGQTLNMADGASLADDFAGIEAALNIFGGTVGNGTEVVASYVTVNGGMVGSSFTVYSDSTVDIHGGTVGPGFRVFSDSTVNIRGGKVGTNFQAGAPNGSSTNVTVNISGGVVGGTSGGFRAYNGSTVNVSGGEINGRLRALSGSSINISGGSVTGIFTAEDESTVTITGGAVDYNINALYGSTVNISGGSIGAFIYARSGSTINLTGSSFILDGVDLTPDMTPNMTIPIYDHDVILEGILADGSPFSFELHSTFNNFSDYYDPLARLYVTLVPEPSAAVLLGTGGVMLIRRRRA